MKQGRNDPCNCGSGEKYKRCCMSKDEAAARSQAPAVAPSPATADVPKARPDRNALQGLVRAPKPKPPSAPPPSLLRKRGE